MMDKAAKFDNEKRKELINISNITIDIITSLFEEDLSEFVGEDLTNLFDYIDIRGVNENGKKVRIYTEETK